MTSVFRRHGVLGGMVTATALAVFVTLLFYVLIAGVLRSEKPSLPRDSEERAARIGASAHAPFGHRRLPNQRAEPHLFQGA